MRRGRQAQGRHVAVKILRPELLSDKTFPARFRREAQVLSTLSHANVVKVFDYGEGQPSEDEAEARPAYIVMALIDGRPLDEVVEENGGTLPTERVLALLADALEGLHEAHRHEVVHRDIKPANLMLRTDGRVMVTDFGIARATAAVSPSPPGISSIPAARATRRSPGTRTGSTSRPIPPHGWSRARRGAPPASRWRPWADLACLTNGGGELLTVAPCGDGQENQLWYLPG